MFNDIYTFDYFLDSRILNNVLDLQHVGSLSFSNQCTIDKIICHVSSRYLHLKTELNNRYTF